MEDKLLEITDADIDEVEKLLGGKISFDAERRAVIKNTDTIDIQAFPGTGKTTVLVAKLAILAKKWPYSNRGICVLSHTNAARDEIEKRLGDTPIGKKLLSYPHFIGTIHSFANEFIAIPYLRSLGYPPVLIDDGITLQRRFNKIELTTKYLSKKRDGKNRCEAIDIPLKIDIGCSENTDSYKTVKSVIRQSFMEGFYTYNEMLFFARHALKIFPTLPQSVQQRFPFLFFDEAQDTSTLQWEIIKKAFTESSFSKIQRFGDSNQAIYDSYRSDDSDITFPKPGYLTISNSKRYGQKITELIKPLAIQDGDKMLGDNTTYNRNDAKHSIILFDDQDIHKVLPAFAEIIFDSFTDEEIRESSEYGFYALGMVHKESDSTDSKNNPHSVKDYFEPYQSNITQLRRTPNNLIDFFRLQVDADARFMLVENIAKGIRHVINECNPKAIPFIKSGFNSLYQLVSDENRNNFKTEFKQISFLPFESQTEWDATIERIKAFCVKWFSIDISSSELLTWSPNAIAENSQSVNEFVYTDSTTKRSVAIRLGSIHSQKGRTHLATLLLETSWYDFNIQHVLPWMLGTSAQKVLSSRDLMKLKCNYVALSRAKGLICIAMPKKNTDEKTINGLSDVGWQIKTI